jgi:hypothetical protein
VTHQYLALMYKFLPRGSRITILEGPYIRQKGWVNSIAFQQPTGFEERAFCYQATLESGKWINVRCLHVAPGWLNDDDLAWLLERLPRLTFPKDWPSSEFFQIFVIHQLPCCLRA